MVKIPSLYELACRAYSRTWMPGYQEAFKEAMLERERPCLILMRIASEVSEIPYGDSTIPNTFMWQVAYMNKELFGLYGPLQNFRGEISQVDVIEGHWEDCWDKELDLPQLNVCRWMYANTTIYMDGIRIHMKRTFIILKKYKWDRQDVYERRRLSESWRI